jgi:beta-phosphoglucomutase-like phosphatase (HAD superfamily)
MVRDCVPFRETVRSTNDGISMYSFLIFDLDDTLIATSSLEDFRGAANVENTSPAYRAALLQAIVVECVRVSISQDFLLRLKAAYPDAKFSVATAAPRFYAATLLGHFYPQFTWDSVVGYEDVTRRKPDPEGLYLAYERAGCSAAIGRESIVLIGDSEKDILAAYHAGIRIILYSACWPERPRPADYRARKLLPDAEVKMTHTLREAIDLPLVRLPAFELCVEGAEFGTVRAPKQKHFCNHPAERVNGRAPTVNVVTLGRLFSEWPAVSERRQWHSPTQQIHDHKNAVLFPNTWITAILRAVQMVTINTASLIFGDMTVVITCIPHKPNRVPRLERLVAQLEAEYRANPFGNGPFVFAPMVLAYRPGARSHHGEHLNAIQRVENTRDNLYVNSGTVIVDQTVIVLDDVVTTGTSLYFAEKFLMGAGAANVICMALTQAIGDV